MASRSPRSTIPRSTRLTPSFTVRWPLLRRSWRPLRISAPSSSPARTRPCSWRGRTSGGWSAPILSPPVPDGGCVGPRRSSDVSRRSRVPTVAAIEGHALGGGCELTLALDFRFMSRGEGRIGLPEASLGLIPGIGGTQRLTRLVGRTRAAELTMLAQRLDADTAQAVGLATAADDARVAALAHARALAQMPSSSTRLLKECLRAAEDDAERGFEVESRAAVEAFGSAAAREGITAFRERREPRFHHDSA